MSIDLSSVRADLSFLSNSIDHKAFAGIYAEADVRSFNANTPALQEAVRYWMIPEEPTEGTVREKTNLLENYAAEIEVVRRYLWEIHTARRLAARHDEPPSLLDRTVTAISTTVNSVLPSTASGRRTLKGVVLLIAGLTSVFFCSSRSITRFSA